LSRGLLRRSRILFMNCSKWNANLLPEQAQPPA